MRNRHAPDCIKVSCANSKFAHDGYEADAQYRPASVIARALPLDKAKQFSLDVHRLRLLRTLARVNSIVLGTQGSGYLCVIVCRLVYCDC